MSKETNRCARSLQRLVVRLALLGDERIFRHRYAGRYSRRMSLVEASWESTCTLYRVGYAAYYGAGNGAIIESPRPPYWRKSHNNEAEGRPHE